MIMISVVTAWAIQKNTTTSMGQVFTLPSILTECHYKKAMVIKLNHNESINPKALSHQVIDGVVVQCQFYENYIVAHGNCKAQSKQALLSFLEKFPCISCKQAHTSPEMDRPTFGFDYTVEAAKYFEPEKSVCTV